MQELEPQTSTPAPQVLHLLNTYLNPTETFIWQYLRQAQKFLPVILADKLDHPEKFPLKHAEFLPLVAKRPAFRRVLAGLQGRYAQVQYVGIEAALKNRNLAVVHVHNGYRACVTRDLLLKLKCPFIINFYGYDVSNAKMLKRAKGDYEHLFKHAAGLVVEGPAMRRRLLNLGAPEAKIRLQPLAINPEEYSFRERKWVSGDGISLLFVGRLVEKKGLQYGLEALAKIRKLIGIPEIRLTVVGDGPLMANLRKQCELLGLNEAVDFVGFQNLEQMRALMQSHDLLLAPSCTAADGDGEGGAPTVLIEAAACGMPILSTTHDDIPFITLSGESALRSGERDSEQLAENLVALIKNPAAWAQMGRKGRAHIMKQHDIRKQAVALEQYYEQLVQMNTK